MRASGVAEEVDALGIAAVVGDVLRGPCDGRCDVLDVGGMLHGGGKPVVDAEEKLTGMISVRHLLGRLTESILGDLKR